MSEQHWDLQLGTLLLSSWANCILYTFELLETYKYFRNFKTDERLIRGAVIIAVISDTACMIGNLASCYLYQVTHFADVMFAVSQPWPLYLYVISTGVSALVTQLFLLSRIIRLGKTYWWLLLFLPCFGAGLAGCFGTAIGLKTATTLAQRASLGNMIVLWNAGSAGSDILLSVVLILLLRSVKSEFENTGSLIRRISVSSLRNGAFTAGVALTALILYEASPLTNLDVMASITLGRVATLTLLSNLNGRRSLRDKAYHEKTKMGQTKGAQHSGSNEDRRNGGVAISKHVVTRYDLDMDQESEVGMELDDKRYSANSTNTPATTEQTWNNVSPWDSRSKVASNTELNAAPYA